MKAAGIRGSDISMPTSPCLLTESGAVSLLSFEFHGFIVVCKEGCQSHYKRLHLFTDLIFVSMQINSTALLILTLTNRLLDGIQNALSCSNVPGDQYCSGLSAGYVRQSLCIFDTTGAWFNCLCCMG